MSAARHGQSWCARPPRTGWEAFERIDVTSPWFAVYRLETGVYALHEPYQAQEVISWLILGPERALLFDTGMGLAPIRSVVEEITRLPVAVLNSHSHYDHMGGNAEFETILALDTDYGRRNARGWDHEAVAEEVAPEAFCAERLPGFDAASYRIRPFRATELVADGHVVDLGGRRLEVLALPGHSPDSIAVIDRAAGFLWPGDTFYEGEIWLYFPGTDLDAYARSVARLAGLAPRLTKVFPSHNTPLASPSRLQPLARAFARVREGSVSPKPRENGRAEYRFDGFSFLMRRPGPLDQVVLE
jgi:glyoxylase-like metal-dependent hydrolase (beta-lactamase superfamily II)